MALGFGFDLMSQAIRQRPWTPRFLFGQGEQGAWYDPSDFATLYQDSAGTTPVTALGQPVGLMLDKSGNGNHASQATPTARPTVQARVNLLTRTEQFEVSPWDAPVAATVDDDAEIAPDGTTTAAKITTSTGAGQQFIRQIPVPTWDNNTTASIYAKHIDCRYLAVSGVASGILANHVYAVFDLVDGDVETTQNCTAVIQAVGNGWFRCTLSKTADAADAQAQFVIALWESVPAASPTASYTATGKSLSVWHPQLERNGSATTYQRVTTATDYADIGLPRYLQFDGIDDAMATASVDFSGTDEMTVCAGLYKASDAATAVMLELSASLLTNNGTFVFLTPNGPAPTYALQAKGTSAPFVVVNDPAYAAPQLSVLSGLTDISQPVITLRQDGAQIATNTASQGTGNYGNYPLYIGSRGGTTLPLNGRIHQLIIRGVTTAGALLDATERYVARKTGVSL